MSRRRPHRAASPPDASLAPSGPLLARHARLLALAASDSTFEPATDGGPHAGDAIWVGRCIHCRAKLIVDAAGRADAQVTIEHILPRTHGGDDSPHNLALACARCNQHKGTRLDVLRRTDERLQRVVAALLAERQRRWREPPAAMLLGEAARAWLGAADA